MNTVLYLQGLDTEDSSEALPFHGCEGAYLGGGEGGSGGSYYYEVETD